MNRLLLLFAAIISVAACQNKTPEPVAEIKGIDSSISPGNNFFRPAGVSFKGHVRLPRDPGMHPLNKTSCYTPSYLSGRLP